MFAVKPIGGQTGDGDGIGVAVFFTFFFFTGFLVDFFVVDDTDDDDGADDDVDDDDGADDNVDDDGGDTTCFVRMSIHACWCVLWLCGIGVVGWFL